MAFEPIVAGRQLTEVSVRTPGIVRVTVAVRFWLPSVAVTTADDVLALVSVPVVAENVAVLCPDVTVTLEGTVSAALLLFTVTVVLELTAWFMVTVQVVEAFWPMEEGAQDTEVSVVTPGIWSVTLAVWFWVPSVAVTTAAAVLEEVSVPVVAENVAVVCPDRTVTLEGTVSAVLLLLREIAVLDSAASFSVTVQVDEALEPSEDGAQATDVMVTGGSNVKVNGCAVDPVPAVTMAV